MSENKTYNIKAFLLPESPNSMASYHAKVTLDGKYKFSIHDCNNAIRLHGDLNNVEDRREAPGKLMCLARALEKAARFISENYPEIE